MTSHAHSHAIAIDAGARFTRIALLGADGVPELARLPGSVPGEGLPVPPGAQHGAALRAAYAAYCAGSGVPDRVVLVVHEQDRAGQARRAVDTLASVHGTDRAPRIRVLGTPHAVLALLRHAGVATARYAVCELGASAVEVSVCVPAGASVAVAGTARHAPDEGYGAGFDRALLAAVGLPDDDTGLRVLAGLRAQEGAAARLGVALRRAVSRGGRYDDTPVHQVDGREITAGVVRVALEQLTADLDHALDRALGGDRTPAPGGAPARPAVAVGGAARFAPLAECLAARQGPLVALPGDTDPALAAVFGAALVAAGRVDPGDRYPYAVCVATHRVVAGVPRQEELVISRADTLEPGGATVFAEADGHRLRVAAGPTPAGPARHVRVRVRDAEGDRTAAVSTVTVPDGGQDDRFHIGVRIAVDGTAHLVLHPLGSAAPGEFPLGTLPTELKGVRP